MLKGGFYSEILLLRFISSSHCFTDFSKNEIPVSGNVIRSKLFSQPFLFQ
jgi:hypothetical protein